MESAGGDEQIAQVANAKMDGDDFGELRRHDIVQGHVHTSVRETKRVYIAETLM